MGFVPTPGLPVPALCLSPSEPPSFPPALQPEGPPPTLVETGVPDAGTGEGVGFSPHEEGGGPEGTTGVGIGWTSFVVSNRGGG